MTNNRLQQLHAAGQSVWLDYIDRAMLGDGTLQRRIRDDAIMGMTSNPTIFEKALAEGTDYDEQLAGAPQEIGAKALFELVATDDVRTACDIFRPVYDASSGGDGYVSIEVSPALASDENGSVAEGRRLWETVDRPNLMIKIPGTPEGARAVRRLLAEGINVNVTLLFSREAYDGIIEQYFCALEDRVARGEPIGRIASVASFFVSRVDSEIDRRIDAMADGKRDGERERLCALKGHAAIANAKLAYRLFQQRFSGARWDALRAKGARFQRPLWASTSTKNPAYRDVIYVEQLVGPETVNTMPPQTLEAFRDHGETRRTVDHGYDAAERQISALESAGISLREVTDKLLVDGLASFQKSYDQLIAGLERKMKELGREVAGTR
ncbi:MAG TPA: transaldolase [Gemmatimonadaceae bacterium]